MPIRILLTYDGSKEALNAFEFARKLLRDSTGELAMLAVIRPSEFAVDFGVQTLIQGVSDTIALDMERLQRRVSIAGVNATTTIRIGNPSQEILRMAREWRADVIVAGHPTRSSFLSIFTGDLTRKLVARAPCPVLVVRTGS